MTPRPRDYLAVVGSGLFALVSAVLLVVGRDRGPALAGFAFFGLGTVALGRVLLAKRRTASNVALVGLVEAHAGRIHENRAEQMVLGVGLGVVGAIGAWSGAVMGLLFVGCSVLIAAFGVWVFLATALGRRANTSIAFEVDGFHVLTPDGERVAQWPEITAVDVHEYNGHPIVVVTSRDGASLSVWPNRFSLDAVLLVRAIGTYVAVPEARQALARREIA